METLSLIKNIILFILGYASECGHRDTCMPLSTKGHCVRIFDFMSCERKCWRPLTQFHGANAVDCHPKLTFSNRLRHYL